MSSSDIAVSVRGLSKAYTIAHNTVPHSTATEAMLHRLRNPFHREEREIFWALKDISFDIKKGDVVGIIGRNGAGKSTLLKILSRITEPTSGEINLYGRVGSLLEVGTGFHPELTGRENIFLNGAILGMTRREINAQFDAIVDFSGIERFLDTPVKRYSSGMYVRLAFAVAAHLRSEILVVDEVLAVGDADFQRKCLGTMRDVAQSGRTIFFVSHNMAAIRALCSSAILMKSGRLDSIGSVETTAAHYLQDAQQACKRGTSPNRFGLSLAFIRLVHRETGVDCDVALFNDSYELVIEVNACKPIPDAGIVARIYDDSGILISTLGVVEEGLRVNTLHGTSRVRFHIPHLQLLPRQYAVSVYVHRLHETTRYLEVQEALRFEVQSANVKGASSAYQSKHGIVRVTDGAFVETAEPAQQSFHAIGAAL